MEMKLILFKLNSIIHDAKVEIRHSIKNNKPVETYKAQQYQQLLNAQKSLRNYNDLEQMHNDDNASDNNGKS